MKKDDKINYFALGYIGGSLIMHMQIAIGLKGFESAIFNST